MGIDRNHGFPSEWELEEPEKKKKEAKRGNRRKGAFQLTEEQERLDNLQVHFSTPVVQLVKDAGRKLVGRELRDVQHQ